MNPEEQTPREQEWQEQGPPHHTPRRRLWLAAAALPVALVILAVFMAARWEQGGVSASPAASAGAHEHDDGEEHGHGEEAGHEEHVDEVRLTPEAVERFGIKVGKAERTVPVQTISAPARVGFNTQRMAHIGSAVEGRVSLIPVQLGDKVGEGDVLLVVDSPELGRMQGEYLAARTAVAAAEPAVEIARDAYERANTLYEETQGISLTETQRRKADLAAARRDLLMAEAERTAAENTLRMYGMSQEQIDRLAETGEVDPRYEVLAPLAGEVIEREATLGELVGPDDERLMVLADLSEVWVLVDVAEAKLGEVGIGTPAALELPALPERSFEGEVTYIAPSVDEATRTARLRIEVENPQGLLRPGMFARAVLSAGEGEMTLAVPAEAVMTVEGGPAVFVPVPGEPNTFAKRPVIVGDRVGGMVPILSGLKEGEPIVTAGTFILKAEVGKAGVEHSH